MQSVIPSWHVTLREQPLEAQVERESVYLGGLGELGDGLSEHLRSRRELEEALGSCGVPVTTLRAAMIIGSGSASFEILRYLVERLPVMITPRWVQTESQPVAIDDVLYWLVECLHVSKGPAGSAPDASTSCCNSMAFAAR